MHANNTKHTSWTLNLTISQYYRITRITKHCVRTTKNRTRHTRNFWYTTDNWPLSRCPLCSRVQGYGKYIMCHHGTYCTSNSQTRQIWDIIMNQSTIPHLMSFTQSTTQRTNIAAQYTDTFIQATTGHKPCPIYSDRNTSYESIPPIGCFHDA